ncbi:hypothetical protein [Solitalea lacus]|uniref:hypothetical protein n=1 Tax=Solitalea lacus TaxID=2911172 RepID=UPI001ED9D7B0|nr:hypothetical protein [Solitalea lacus]UKJ06552.1 hypothetical protein L2B55_13535 [Solitalea lacus]
MVRSLFRSILSILLLGVVLGSPSYAQQKKPNILVIFGDDIVVPQISTNTMGLMGYQTPNIDRIAKEGNFH